MKLSSHAALTMTLSIVTVALLRAPQASACSGPMCLPDQFLPFEGSLPANAPGILWRPGFRYRNDDDAGTWTERRTQVDELRFRCTGASGTAREVSFHLNPPSGCGGGWCVGGWFIVPDEPLTVGDECEIGTSVESCNPGWVGDGPVHLRGSTRFAVTAAASYPTALGDITQTSARDTSVTLSSVGCDANDELCVVDIQWALGDAEPWRDVLVYTTYVNDQVWRPAAHAWVPPPTGGSWVERGRDRIFRHNPDLGLEYPGVQTTTATVRIAAQIPGSTQIIESAPITVTLDCPASEPDAAVPDATVPDAATPDAASLDAAAPPAMPPSSAGCTCTTAGARPRETSPWWLSAWIVALLAWRTAARAKRERSATCRVSADCGAGCRQRSLACTVFHRTLRGYLEARRGGTRGADRCAVVARE